MSSLGAPSAGPSTPPNYSSGPSTPPSYSSGPSTPPNYSPGSSRNAECSNCKHLPVMLMSPMKGKTLFTSHMVTWNSELSFFLKIEASDQQLPAILLPPKILCKVNFGLKRT
nr:auxin response factor 1 [Tanacetum cinerariifolium]